MFRFCDGCDSYSADKDLINIWDDVGIGWRPASGEGVRGGGALKADGPAIAALRKNIRWAPFQQNEPWSVFRTFMWVKIAEPPDEETFFMHWRDNPPSSSGLSPDTPEGLPVLISAAGELVFCKHNGIEDPPLYVSPEICDNRWHSLETFHWGRADPSGVLRVVLDNVVLFDEDTLNLAGSTFWVVDRNQFNIHSVGKPMWIDDVIVWDDRQELEGNFEFYSPVDHYPEWGNDGFMGPLSGPKIISTSRPAADGDQTQWTSSEPTHVEAVDEQTSDFRETVITSDKFGSVDLFGFNPLANLTGITAVINSVQARATDYGSVTLRPIAKSDAVTRTDLFRQRVVGKHVVEQDLNQPELITNSGIPFVDTAGWSPNMAGVDLSVVDGELRIQNISENYTWGGGAIAAVATVVGQTYVVKMARSYSFDGTYPTTRRLHLRVTNNSDGTSPFSVQELSLLPGEVGVGIFEATATTTYILAEMASPAPDSWVQMIYATARLAIEGPKHHLKQWAFTYDPATEVAWEPDGVNAAQFGIQATYLPEGHR